MSWEPEKSRHSEWSYAVDPRKPHSAAPATQSSYSYTREAAQRLEPQSQNLQHARTTEASGASINPAMVAVAQQKARYARFSYATPPALRHSSLRLSSTTNTSGVLDRTQRVDKAHHALTQPAAWSQPLPSACAQHRTTADARSTTRAAANQSTTLYPPPPPPLYELIPPPSEWLQALVSLQERQLLCWQQLTETQQLMTHHVERLQEEVRCVHEVLAHALGKHSRTEVVVACAANPVKRSRPDGNDRCEAATPTKSVAALPSDNTAATQRNMSAHRARLLGESTASTPAVMQDAPAYGDVCRPAALAQRLPSRSTAEPKESNGGEGGAAHSQSTAGAADSEADIFML
ncbi:hypothetical protein GH5_05366 [Leishmania sp. Ghana 2012 LV757]|uniref:hypothetical protein n=1 Tax=Leishmania sp. Ghana 2012 LV757 TaxID=2803181 RepID=UPI001B724910|nr:hypothetical protein GH5_05366 [Leishmania sp. Ghana 2012 LV757]